jgi:nucleoside-diphosphate-sugar epimerase
VTRDAKSGPRSVRLVIVGVGLVGRELARLAAASRELVGTTRSPERALGLRREGIAPLVADPLTSGAIARVAAAADVVVTFPPDGRSDARVAAGCRAARRVVYVSSTAVYGAAHEKIDASTPIAPDSSRALRRAEAEEVWREAGATIVRAPAIYGPSSGLHVRLLRNAYNLPGNGSNVTSRIHVADLAAILLAALERGPRGATYVVGDLEPAPQREVVEWLCKRLGLALPPSIPLEQAPETLRSSRAVDSREALEALGVTLRYPTYREGFGAALDGVE